MIAVRKSKHQVCKPCCIVCDVCQINEAMGVSCSSLAAMSIAYCEKCLLLNSEPLWLLLIVLEICGGPDKVSSSIKECTSFAGQYLDWSSICLIFDSMKGLSQDE